MKRLTFGGVVVLAVVAFSVAGVRAQRESTAAPTFNQDVAPILFSNCVSCHSPGQIAPMSLRSYKEARPWARAIKTKVVAREMPPWHADPRFGAFNNGRNLSQAEIDTMVAWADRGALEGPGAAPAPPPMAAGGWSHPSGRPPDLVIEMALEIAIPAQGQIPWFDIVQPWPFHEDKFVEAVQVVAGNVAVVHHLGAHSRIMRPGTKIGSGPAWPGGPILSNIQINEDGTATYRRDRDGQAAAPAGQGAEIVRDVQNNLTIYVPPSGFNGFQPGVGKRIPKDSVLHWTLHYTPTGRPEKDRSRLGLWFQQVPMPVETLTRSGGDVQIAQGREVSKAVAGATDCGGPCLPAIPPNEGNYKVTSITAFKDDASIHLMWPHMHLRGKDMTYLVTYPDGREEVLLSIPRYNFNWQIYYGLAEPAKIPAGSTLKVIGHFDNSAKNRENPAPNKEVYWSEQSWDEMFSGFYEVSIDKRDKAPVNRSSR